MLLVTSFPADYSLAQEVPFSRDVKLVDPGSGTGEEALDFKTPVSLRRQYSENGTIGEFTGKGYSIDHKILENLMEPTPYKLVAEEDPTLTSSINAIISKYEKSTKVDDYGFCFMDLTTGAYYGKFDRKLAKTRTFGTTEAYFNGASTAKLYVCYSVYKLAEAGFIDLDTLITDWQTGERFTLRTTVRKALRLSDNHSFSLMVRALGPKTISKVLEIQGIEYNWIYGEIGSDSTNNLKRYGTVKTSRVNPYGASLILRQAYEGRKQGNPFMTEFDENLRNNIYSTRIPKALGYRVPVAHKTGTWEEKGIYNDVGIVYAEHPYIIVFFTYDQDINKAHTFIRGITSNVDKLMTTRYAKKQKPKGQ